MKKLLFVAWDGPQTTYMEGLFMPIFREIHQKTGIEFHVMQFTSGDSKRVSITQKAAKNLGIKYTAISVSRNPFAAFWKGFTIYSSSGTIEKYVRSNSIDTVMPRGYLPAKMLNGIKEKNFNVIFDADGLQIQERVDYAGLKPGSLKYKWMTSAYNTMLQQADVVLTRSHAATDIHVNTIGEKYRHKFFTVLNGRDKNLFDMCNDFRKTVREELCIGDDFLFVYSGSLGPQYCWEEMSQIFSEFSARNPSKFLILTGNLDFALSRIPKDKEPFFIVKQVSADKVPYYLNSADVAFALRKPFLSMKGVAPIKLGEYLLCGLPVIAGKGIGDTETILKQINGNLLCDCSENIQNSMEEILSFLESAKLADKKTIRTEALEYFSLEASAESYIRALKYSQSLAI